MSVPSAAIAIPSVTETAAPDDEPPGNARIFSVIEVQRRAIMRVNAEARKCEFGHICAANRHQASSFQPPPRWHRV